MIGKASSAAIAILFTAACGSGGGDPACPEPGDRTLATGSERFGGAVSAGPDADGDGHPDVLVGDPSTEQTDQLGVVSLVSGATGEVVRTWQSDEPGDGFGARVSLGPDVDGDGLADVLVAAPGFASDRGRVTLYGGATGAVLATWNGADFARLGQAISLGPDLDGDGRGDVAMTDALAYDEEIDGDVVTYRNGRLYLVSGTGAALATIDAPDRNTRFGTNAQLGSDVDGDGAGDVVVTDPDGGGSRRGLVQLYSGATGDLLRTWVADSSTADFGTAAALGTDADGDGVPDVAMAMMDTVTLEERVELHSGATGQLLHTWASLNWRIIEPGRLAIADVDDDGRGDVAISAAMKVGGTDDPAITTYVYSGASGAPIASWSHAEHRYFETRGVAAVPDSAGCAALVVIGIAEVDPGDEAGRVELRRLTP
jgi:hypothetical protein